MAARSLVSWLAVAMLGWTIPAAADDLASCQDTDHADISIPACTRIIDSGTETGEFLGMLHDLRALAYCKAHDYARAIPDFNDALALEGPSMHKDTLRVRGAAYLMNGDYEKALADYTAALNPPDAVGLNNRGLTYLKMKRYAAAVADYSAALKLQPQTPQALYGRGVAELALGEKVAAEKDKRAARLLQNNVADTFAPFGIR